MLRMVAIIRLLFIHALPSSATEEDIENLKRIIAIQNARITSLEQRLPVIVTNTQRPGEYDRPKIIISKKIAGGAPKMHKFGDTKLSIEQERPVFISGTITIRPVNYDATFLGIAVTATKGDTTLVLADSKSPNGAIWRGSGDGPYGRPRSDAYTTFPVSGMLMLPEAGVWNLQFLLENVSQSVKITVHTFSLTAIAL